MRIGINARQLLGDKDGIGYYAYHLIRNLMLIDKYNEYILFLPSYCPLSLENDNFRIGTTRFPTSTKLFRGFWEHFILPLEARDKKINLLHCLADISPFIFKGKLVLTIHDISFLLLPQIIPRSLYIYYSNFISHAAFRADRIIAISNNTKQDLIRLLGIPIDKIRVIYHGVNPIYYPISHDIDSDLKQKYNIRNKFILYLGSLVKRKNLGSLIRAYLLLKKTKHIEQQLVIAGGRGYPFCRDVFILVRELDLEDDVIFTGYVSEQEALLLYNTADLFVYPSLYEGFGLPNLEAMACGCPVITSRNSSLSEIAEGAAILVDPYNIKEIADAMYSVLTDNRLRNQLIQKGFQRSRQFSWRYTALQTISIYEEILNNY